MVWLAAAVVALSGAGALYQFFGARRSAARFPPPGRLIDAGDHRLHVVCEGSGGPAVIFESGIAASSLSWVRVRRDVAAFTRACAYDRTGLGWSEPAHGPRSVARMIDELHAVVHHAGSGQPAILVGHSF